MRDIAIIDRSYPRWVLYAAVALAAFAAIARPVVGSWALHTEPTSDATFIIGGAVIEALGYAGVGAILALSRHLSPLRAVIFVALWYGMSQALLLLSVLVPAVGVFLFGALSWFTWLLPMAILFAAGAAVGAFAKPRPLLRLFALAGGRIAVLALLANLPYTPGAPLGAAFEYGEPALSEFLLVLVCLELFAPCRADGKAPALASRPIDG